MASRFMSVMAIVWAGTEGAWVRVASSCCSGTRDTSRKPGPHSLQCDDWVRSLEVSFWDVGSDVVCVRLSPCCPCISPAVSDPFMCKIFWDSESFAWPFVVGTPVFLLLGVGLFAYPPGS